MRLCMIGCGEHAESSQGPAQPRYAATHAGTELAACCDLDGARAERHRQRFGFARAYTDVAAMLDAEKPDAVVAAVPVQSRYAATHAGTELAACCDLDGARAERHRQRFGFARAYTDVAAMLDAEKRDAVVAAVPVHRTAAVGAALLERGLPLLLEKPPGQTVQEVDALIAAAE